MNYPTKLAYSLFGVMIWVFCILGLYYALNFSYTTAFQGNLYGVSAIQYAIDAFVMMVLLFALAYSFKLTLLVIGFIRFIWSKN